MCPVCRGAYPVLKQLSKVYEPNEFRLVFHVFPLPYHTNAYSVNQAAIFLTKHFGESAFQPWMEVVFTNQERFGNKVTAHQGQREVIETLRKLAQHTFPSLSTEEWSKGMSGSGGTFADTATRTAWKYACSRRITGTPSFLLNGVGGVEASTLADWRKIIDPMVKKNNNLHGNTKNGTLAVEQANEASKIMFADMTQLPRMGSFSPDVPLQCFNERAFKCLYGRAPFRVIESGVNPLNQMCCRIESEFCLSQVGCLHEDEIVALE